MKRLEFLHSHMMLIIDVFGRLFGLKFEPGELVERRCNVLGVV